MLQGKMNLEKAAELAMEGHTFTVAVCIRICGLFLKAHRQMPIARSKLS
jgi:hypothetical protein